jgi:long-chain fatty acid transport protein
MSHIFSPRLVFLGAALLFAAGIPWGATVTASPFDTYGVGARASAMGGAFTAAGRGADAVYYNIAGVAGTERPELRLGFSSNRRWFQVGGADSRSDWLTAAQLALALPVPLGAWLEDRVVFGLTAHLPTSELLLVELPDDRAPSFPLLDEQTRRLVVVGGLAVRVFDWWSLGLGLSLLPDVNADVAVDLTGVGGTNDASIAVDYSLSLIAGTTFRPRPWLGIGLAYRAGNHTQVNLSPVRVDVASNLDPVRTNITAPAYATPHQVALGIEVVPLPSLTVVSDLTWSGYGSWQQATPSVTLCAACPRDCSAGDCPDYCMSGSCELLFEDRAEAQVLSDTFSPRVGVEWRLLDRFAFRGGYGFVPTPFSDQSGQSNLLDGDRHILSTGFGYRVEGLGERWPAALRVDAHLQVQWMPRRAAEKDTDDADGDGVPDLFVPPGGGSGLLWPSVSGEARLLTMGVDLTLEF